MSPIYCRSATNLQWRTLPAGMQISALHSFMPVRHFCSVGLMGQIQVMYDTAGSDEVNPHEGRGLWRGCSADRLVFRVRRCFVFFLYLYHSESCWVHRRPHIGQTKQEVNLGQHRILRRLDQKTQPCVNDSLTPSFFGLPCESWGKKNSTASAALRNSENVKCIDVKPPVYFDRGFIICVKVGNELTALNILL